MAGVFDRYEGEEEKPSLILDMLSILYKTLTVGDQLNGVDIDSFLVYNIRKLPQLQAGVTHEKDGELDELLKRFPIEKVRELMNETIRERKRIEKVEEFKEINRKRRMEEEENDKDELPSCDTKRKLEKDPISVHPPKKKSKNERVCSSCKLSKSLSDGFSKNQRGKGNNARCKECVGANKGAAGENKQATSKLEGPGITGELYHQLRLHCMAFLGGHNKATQRNAFLFLYCNFMLCA